MRGSASSDHNLALAAAEGSVEAWHEFVERYSGLIYSLICRYLAHPDEDERGTVYVQVLETLHDGALARYDGRASISTWIGVVTRSRCMDHIRKERGRRQAPVWLEGLSERDQQVYRRYYLEGQGFTEICDPETGNGRTMSVEDLMESLDRIDEHLDRSLRRRLAFEFEARSVPVISGRLLEYLAFARQEAEQSRATYRADLAVLESEARHLTARLEIALLKLEKEEREVVRLRFKEGLTADGVATRLGLRSTRRVYTISDRAVSKLKGILGEPGASA